MVDMNVNNEGYTVMPKSGKKGKDMLYIDDIVRYYSPSKFASIVAKGSRTAIDSYISDIYDSIDSDLVRFTVGLLAHKADEFLINEGLFATANSITHDLVVKAVNHAFHWYGSYEHRTEINSLIKQYVPDACIDYNGEKLKDYAKVVLALVARFVMIFNDVDRNLESELTMEGYVERYDKHFRGTADIIEHHDNGEVTIWDIKHYRAPSAKDFNSFDIQAGIYADLYEQTTGTEVTHIGTILPAQRKLKRKVRP